MLAYTSVRLLITLFKLLKGTNCFKFLKRRIPAESIRLLHRIVDLRCKIACIRAELFFLSECVTLRRYPRSMLKLLRKNKLAPSDTNLRRIASAHMDTLNAKLTNLIETHVRLMPVVEDLSICCRIVFTIFCQRLTERTKEKRRKRLLNSLRDADDQTVKRDFGKYVLNVSDVQLDDLQLEALAMGIDYKITPNKLNRLFVEAQFENFFDQVAELQSTSDDAVSWFRNKLADIAYEVLMVPINEKCALTSRHLKSLRELKNKGVVILKPDKGSGAVIMNKTDYVQKMLSILSDESKFQRVDRIEKLTEVEARVNRHLEMLLLHRVLDQATHKTLKPNGSLTPQLYGLPKTHKEGMPLRPILSMVNSPQHKLARWLVRILAPLRQHFNLYGIKDSFEILEDLDEISLSDKVMCSVDVQSLFTNVPLLETIDYICQLIEEENFRLPIPTDLLRQSLLLCTENVAFRFQHTSYRQIDGVAMGSPLGPILADFFMLMLERKLNRDISQLPYYKRYVDDILVFGSSKIQVERLVDKLNSAHANLKVTCEFESDGRIPYLDILISRRDSGLIKRSVYRKPTWSGQYLHFTSFSPMAHKRALVKTLFTRARRICSNDCLPDEFELITKTLMENGYPKRFIEKHSQIRPPKQTVLTAPKKKVYIELPFKGNAAARRTTKRLVSAIQRTYCAAEAVVINRTRRLLLPSVKEEEPIGAKSHCIYQFLCNCGVSYIGRTDRALDSRMKEHLPNWVQRAVNQPPSDDTCSRKPPASSIGRHILATRHQINPSSAFQILLRHPNSRLLRFAEAAAISRIKPALCVQKQLVVNLRLPWS